MKRFILWTLFSLFVISEAMAITRRDVELLAKMNHAADTCRYFYRGVREKPFDRKLDRNFKALRRSVLPILTQNISCDTIFYSECIEIAGHWNFFQTKGGRHYIIYSSVKRGKIKDLEYVIYPKEEFDDPTTRWEIERIREEASDPTRWITELGYIRDFRIIVHGDQVQVEAFCYHPYFPDITTQIQANKEANN